MPIAIFVPMPASARRIARARAASCRRRAGRLRSVDIEIDMVALIDRGGDHALEAPLRRGSTAANARAA